MAYLREFYTRRIDAAEFRLPAPLSGARWRRDLVGADITELLRAGPVQFVVHDPIRPISIVPLAESFAFWKAEAKPRIVGSERIYLEDYPGEYAYAASEWNDGGIPAIVLLDRFH